MVTTMKKNQILRHHLFGQTHLFLDAYGYALALGEPCCEEHHGRGPKGFQLTWPRAAPVIGEQQLDPSASGPLRRQEVLSGVGQRTFLQRLRAVMQLHNVLCL